MQVWNVLHAARCKYRTQKRRENHHLGTIAQLCRAISLQLRHVSTIGKKIVKQQYLLHMPHNMANFSPLTAEIGWPVRGTPANFHGFRVLTALLHGTPVVGVSQTFRHWTEGATYIRQDDHHVGHWPTFLVRFRFAFCVFLCHFVPVVFAFGVLGLVRSVLARLARKLGRTSPTWPILCQVRRKTLTHSISQSFFLSKLIYTSVCWCSFQFCLTSLKCHLCCCHISESPYTTAFWCCANIFLWLMFCSHQGMVISRMWFVLPTVSHLLHCVLYVVVCGSWLILLAVEH